MTNKIEAGKSENLTKRGRGRPKGSANKTTQAAKSMIEEAATRLGGVERMVKWAKEAPENERAFWATIYPKLLPLQINGSGEKGAILHEIALVGVEPDDAGKD